MCFRRYASRTDLIPLGDLETVVGRRVESSLFAKHSVENTSIVFKETEMIRMGEGLKRFSWIVLALLLLCGLPAWAQSQSAASSAPAAAAPPPGPAMDAPLNVKAAQPPSADDLAKGDPSGTKTGTVNDAVISDPNKGLTLADTVNQVGQNRIAINSLWPLVTGL